MAKMFYTLDETKAALGRNEEGIKQLAREGRLREFRDGPRLMFKADQVESLKAELAGGEGISLAPDTGSGLSLQAGESRAGASGSGTAIPLADSSGGIPSPKGDTGLDLVGGSALGVPSPGKVVPSGIGSGIGSGVGTGMQSGSGLLNLGGSGAGSGMAGSGVSSGGTRGGITIFDVDESQRVDPSAQTAINAGVQDQINLEGVGSGSGLLDLTRESDDTSLGAVFDELSPGQAGGARRQAPAAGISAMETQAGASDIGPGIIDRGPRTVAAPIYVEQADPVAAALGGAALAATLVLFFGAFILIATILGYRPDILNTLRYDGDGQLKMYFFIAIGITLVFGVIGYIIGKASAKNA